MKKITVEFILDSKLTDEEINHNLDIMMYNEEWDNIMRTEWCRIDRDLEITIEEHTNVDPFNMTKLDKQRLKEDVMVKNLKNNLI